MSNEILAQLLATHAYDGSPLHVDMPALHVPFDDRGRTGTESSVLRAARSTERLGVRGPIGCGKTSLLRYTLDDPTGMIAPIWVSVAFDEDQVVLDVRRFAAHLIQSIVRDAQRAGTLTARDRDAILTAAAARRPLPGSERRLAARLAAKFWVARGDLAGEVVSTLTGVDLQRPADEVLDALNRALEAITAADRLPVIVVDDSDSFTRRHGGGSTRDQSQSKPKTSLAPPSSSSAPNVDDGPNDGHRPFPAWALSVPHNRRHACPSFGSRWTNLEPSWRPRRRLV